MASFNAHVGGVAANGFTPLPSVYVSGILDTIITDIGAGVNGWTVYEDQRSGSGPGAFLIRTTTAAGILNNVSYFYSNYGFNFINGQQYVSGNYSYGFEWPYNISYSSSSQTPISVDGTNWYTAYYWGSGASTTFLAKLPVNFSGTTGYRGDVYQKLLKYIVLQCSSSQKTFYVRIATPSERAGGPYLYIQPYETWDSGTHSGTNGGPMEHARIYLEGGSYLTTAKCQLITWFLPNVLAIWTGGISGFGSPIQNLCYIGNLDVSGAASSSNDTDALCYINGDTMYTGHHVGNSNNIAFSQPNPGGNTGPYYTTGAIQCLRTRAGTLWKTPTTINDAAYSNAYNIYPRGRFYGFDLAQSSMDTQSRMVFSAIDLWHTGSPFANSVNTEGRRGKVRYVMMPQQTPVYMNLKCSPVCNDGNTYIFVKTGWGAFGQLYSNSGRVINTDRSLVQSNTSAVCSGWAWAMKSNWTTSFNYFTHGQNTYERNTHTCNAIYVALPINI